MKQNKNFILLFFLFFFSIITYAKGYNLPDNVTNKLINLLDHPSVLEKKQIHLSNKAEIDEAKSQLLPTINFSTNGGYSLFGNYSQKNSRTKNASGNYIDGKINTRQLLYDSDTTIFNIKSQISKTNSSKFDIKIAENEIIYRFLSFCLETQRYKKNTDIYNDTIFNLNKISKLAEKQFIAGLTNEKEFREIKMLLTELDVKRKTYSQLTQTALKALSNEFGENIELLLTTYDKVIDFSKNVTIQNLIFSNHNKQYSLQKLEFQSKSIGESIVANENDKKPKVFLNLDTTFFNINELDTEYELSANLSVDFPFFDAGVNASRNSSLYFQQQSIFSRLELEKLNAKRRLLSINENEKNNIEQIKIIEKQISEVINYISQLNAQLGSVDVSLREIASSYKKLYDLKEVKLSIIYNQDVLYLEKIWLKESWVDLVNMIINTPTSK